MKDDVIPSNSSYTILSFLLHIFEATPSLVDVVLSLLPKERLAAKLNRVSLLF
jgi:hypothetical protein